MQLDRFNATRFDRGASRSREALWVVTSALFVGAWWPGSGWRVLLLRCFGAKIGTGVVIKPYVRVKFPWRLSIGAQSWIGEGVWIDNLAQVSIGEHACVSQESYICTGSHDWGTDGFDLIVKPIMIGDRVWVSAQSRICPGCICSEGVIVTLGSVASGNLDPWTIYSGHPAIPIRERPRPSSATVGTTSSNTTGQERHNL